MSPHSAMKTKRSAADDAGAALEPMRRKDFESALRKLQVELPKAEPRPKGAEHRLPAQHIVTARY